MTDKPRTRPTFVSRSAMGGVSGKLSADDLSYVADLFGVAEAQIRRDHAISHVLGIVGSQLQDAVIFIGDTALSRTHLSHARISEDIDLISIGPRRETADALVRALDIGLIRVLGRPRWNPSFDAGNDVSSAVLEIGEDIAVRIQLLDGRFYSRWPIERRSLEQRYLDAPPAELNVPTVESFVGWKTAAWHDRGAARDLYDLWALAHQGYLTADAAALFAKHGTTGGPPRKFMFTTAPPEQVWRDQLAGQTRLEVTAADALAAVRTAWSTAMGERW